MKNNSRKNLTLLLFCFSKKEAKKESPTPDWRVFIVIIYDIQNHKQKQHLLIRYSLEEYLLASIGYWNERLRPWEASIFDTEKKYTKSNNTLY